VMAGRAITFKIHSIMLQKSDSVMRTVVLPNQYPLKSISVPTEASVTTRRRGFGFLTFTRARMACSRDR
jgi:hypothetical protein